MPPRPIPDVKDDTGIKITAFRCPKDLLARLQYKAKRDRRSLSNYIICLIEKDVADVELPPSLPAKKRA